ncbi:hypothetical protein EDD18DRAFT_1076572 [Armillaria luteobubalina]|uniref:BTB domain-containing protein n=1 Tax=Armillaria luteobubalina TaxID=153913 RepID=A0AA39US34_9AGAR|nr:hypothetical protein EDD18DRAFT_1076572 [Armillaria luteobubalina]
MSLALAAPGHFDYFEAPADSPSPSASEEPPLTDFEKSQPPNRRPLSLPQTDHYWEYVIFQVEDAFFKVPTHHFVTHSEVFADMLSLPQGQAAEGQSRENPITLPVSKRDFRTLLCILYPLVVPKSPSFNKEELISLLKLSKLWGMKQIREYAIEKIGEILQLINATERITLGREYSVEGWLRSGYIALAARHQVVSVEDARVIGWESALLLGHVREETYALFARTRMGRVTFSEDDVKAGVESKFRVEFQDVRKSEAAYRA